MTTISAISATEQYLMSVVSMRNTIKEYGMSRGFMYFLNSNGQLNKLFEMNNLSVNILAVEEYNQYDTIDSNSEQLVLALESIISTIVNKIKELWNRLLKFIRELWDKLVKSRKTTTDKLNDITQQDKSSNSPMAIQANLSAENQSDDKPIEIYTNEQLEAMSKSISSLCDCINMLLNIIDNDSNMNMAKIEAHIRNHLSKLATTCGVKITIANNKDKLDVTVTNTQPPVKEKMKFSEVIKLPLQIGIYELTIGKFEESCSKFKNANLSSVIDGYDKIATNENAAILIMKVSAITTVNRLFNALSTCMDLFMLTMNERIKIVSK